jgi:hypothetical protein
LNDTDETATLNALLASWATTGGCLAIDAGKTLRADGQIVFPYGSGPSYVMPSIRITGAGASGAFSDHTPTTPPAGSILDLRYNGTRLYAYGQGTLEIDHLTITNGGTSCGTFIYTNLANANIHNNAFWGSTSFSGATSCEDAWVGGGTNLPSGTFAVSSLQYFQGYSSYYGHNSHNRMQRGVLGRSAFNGVTIEDNLFAFDCGSSQTDNVFATTSGTTTTLTLAPLGFFYQYPITLNISGYTGNWAALNGRQVVTVINNTGSINTPLGPSGADGTYALTNATRVSVPINSSSFGAVTGTPVYLAGAAIEINGSSRSFGNQAGNRILNNTIESLYYPYGVRIQTGINNTLESNSCWDSQNLNHGYVADYGIACYRFEWDSDHNRYGADYWYGIELAADGSIHGNVRLPLSYSSTGQESESFFGSGSTNSSVMVGLFNGDSGGLWGSTKNRPYGAWMQLVGRNSSQTGLSSPGSINFNVDSTTSPGITSFSRYINPSVGVAASLQTFFYMDDYGNTQIGYPAASAPYMLGIGAASSPNPAQLAITSTGVQSTTPLTTWRDSTGAIYAALNWDFSMTATSYNLKQAGLAFVSDSYTSSRMVVGAYDSVGLAPTGAYIQFYGTTNGASLKGGSELVMDTAAGLTAFAVKSFTPPSTYATLLSILSDGTAFLAGTTYSTLSTQANGFYTYCSDCTVGASCTGSGTGAWAFKSAGTWKCPF